MSPLSPGLPACTESDIISARADVERGVRGLVACLVATLAVVELVGGVVAATIVGAGHVLETAVWSSVVGIVVGLPVILAINHMASQRGLAIAVEKATQTRLMESAASRREFETRLGRALEMAEDEVAAHDTIRRALWSIAPDVPVELLLADHSYAHLQRVVVSVPEATAAPGCPVDSPHRCFAVRRAQTQIYDNSEAIDACPLLRNRDLGPCSAVCIPVSMMGRSVGVVHAVTPVDSPLDDDVIQSLQTLADQAGHSLGLLQIMAEAQLQAMTDGLTGLMNRRSLENRVRALRAAGINFAVVIADLDHFKELNDTHGHESGDRALRVFAQALRGGVRAEDVACRYGGEEFMIVLPRTDTYEAIEITERIRQALAAAIVLGEVPAFTASFGIAHSDNADDVDDLVQRADRALFAAKEGGRNRTCIDGHAAGVAQDLTTLR